MTKHPNVNSKCIIHVENELKSVYDGLSLLDDQMFVNEYLKYRVGKSLVFNTSFDVLKYVKEHVLPVTFYSLNFDMELTLSETIAYCNRNAFVDLAARLQAMRTVFRQLNNQLEKSYYDENLEKIDIKVYLAKDYPFSFPLSFNSQKAKVDKWIETISNYKSFRDFLA